MAGWRLETTRFAMCITFPVFAFWIFNQPDFFKFFVSTFIVDVGSVEEELQLRNYKLPDTRENDAALKDLTTQLAEQRRREDYEKMLLEKMAFEEARRAREKAGL